MIKIITKIETLKINNFKLVNKSIKDDTRIVIPIKSKNKNKLTFNVLISDKEAVGVLSRLKCETINK